MLILQEPTHLNTHGRTTYDIRQTNKNGLPSITKPRSLTVGPKEALLSHFGFPISEGQGCDTMLSWFTVYESLRSAWRMSRGICMLACRLVTNPLATEVRGNRT